MTTTYDTGGFPYDIHDLDAFVAEIRAELAAAAEETTADTEPVTSDDSAERTQ